MARFQLKVNGKARVVEADPSATLLSVLRDQLGLKGARHGCGEGQCGTCTVIAGGEAVRACLVSVSDVQDKSIVTIEGLASRKLHPVQDAFVRTAAFQCGFCTPGMILEAVALLAREPDPPAARIRTVLEGHLCRCGAYPRIVEAVRLAAKGGRRA